MTALPVVLNEKAATQLIFLRPMSVVATLDASRMRAVRHRRNPRRAPAIEATGGSL
jgi:hypothetical protein